MTSNDRHFSTDHLKSGLKERAVKSVGITLAAQAIKLIIQVGSIAILARLLIPSDFGLVAMVTVFTGLAIQFTDGGLSMATIQREHVTHVQVSNLFWVNVMLGGMLCVLAILVAPLISMLYDEPRLTLVMMAMSSTFIIGGLSVQHDALLRRQMRFRAISIIDIVSMAMGAAAGIIAALAGLEYWALVLSPIITVLAQTIMRWLSLRWLPSRMTRDSGVKPLLTFGAHLTGANFVGYLASNLTTFSVGYIGGPQTLGLFNRANMLTSIPSRQMLPPVLNVLQPTIARVANEPARLSSTIASTMGKLVLVTMFVTLTMGILADLIVKLFLGSAWDGAVPLFRMLAVFSLVEPIAGFLAVSLVAVGNAKALLKWKFITLAILVLSLAIGSLWGTFGIVAAYALSGLLIRLPGFIFYSCCFLPVSVTRLAGVIIPPAICAMITASILYALRLILHVENSVLGLIVFVSVSAVVYFSLCCLIKSTRGEIMECIEIIKVFVRRKAGEK